MLQPYAAKAKGRPTKYDAKFCQDLIAHCRRGRTFDSFALKIGVHIDTIHEWASVHPQFSEAKKRAKVAAEDYLYQLGLNGVSGDIKGFAQGAWVFMMKARFGWSEDGPAIAEEEVDMEFV